MCFPSKIRWLGLDEAGEEAARDGGERRYAPPKDRRR